MQDHSYHKCRNNKKIPISKSCFFPPKALSNKIFEIKCINGARAKWWTQNKNDTKNKC